MSLDGTMLIGGIELPPGLGFLFRSWCTSVYATLCLRKEILSMYNSIIAVERTDGAEEGKQNRVFYSMTLGVAMLPSQNREGILSYK